MINYLIFFIFSIHLTRHENTDEEFQYITNSTYYIYF